MILLFLIYPSLAAKQKVIIFGGSGGVGQLISKSLTTNNFDVGVVTRSIIETKKFANLEGCDFFLGNALQTETLIKPLTNIENIVISVGTTAFPTSKWSNGNTPKRACYETVENILNVATKNLNKLKRVVLISSIGVERTSEVSCLHYYGFKT